jgi:creatinine amidohydrolase/Fe(II)-dependent formamide hydrolase-like protein
VIYLKPWEQVPASVYAGVAPGFEVHCGEIETSLMLHLLPETVRSDRRDNPVPFQAPWQDMFSMKTLSGGEGHAGHPTRATADKGRAFAEAVITHSARALTGLLAMADRFDHY